MTFMLIIIWIFNIYYVCGLKIIHEYERIVVFTHWRYTTILEPGLRFVWPLFQSAYKINLNKNFNELSIELKDLEIPADITIKLLNEIKKLNNSNIQQNESVRKD